MSDALDRILADVRRRVDGGGYAAAGIAARPTDGAVFTASLREPGVRVIAEIKAQSPSAGTIIASMDAKLETLAVAYRRGHAAAISVVTERDSFGGRPDWISRVKAIAGLPVLMKDFFVDLRQLDFAVSLGADAVLLIARALADEDLALLRTAAGERGLAAVVEVHAAEEIPRAARVAPDVIGVNARDLATFATSLESVAALAPLMPQGPIRLAESGISSREDVSRLSAVGYQAFLVGEALLRSDDPEEMLRGLRA